MDKHPPGLGVAVQLAGTENQYAAQHQPQPAPSYSVSEEQVQQRYIVMSKLGSGAFSEVFLCQDRQTNEQFAMKIIDKVRVARSRKDLDVTKQIKAEIDILRKVNHPHVVKMREALESEGKLYLILELVTGGELFDRIAAMRRGYTEADACKLFTTVVQAVDHLHSLGVVHRDLKPENILLASQTDATDIKLTDFGLSRIIGETGVMHTCVGTTSYMAPEILMRQPYDKSCDFWSLGVILYILLCGFPPFGGKPAQIIGQVKNGIYRFPDPYWTNISNEAKDLVKSLLKTNPAERATAQQILMSPWVHRFGEPQAPAVELHAGVISNFKEYKQRYQSRSMGGDSGMISEEDFDDIDNEEFDDLDAFDHERFESDAAMDTQ
eukprot:GFYU01002285.1.p1 GENE.GFYU01002285.1~~GFYU01002285.1.p1  ORF type:complete len:380 (-),score=123.49 GFYU01002285.1:272-1411(-)